MADVQRAQEILRKAMMKVLNECLAPHDPVPLLVIIQICVAGVVADCVPLATVVNPEKIENLIRTSTNMLERFLREDIEERLEAPRKVRH